MIITGSARAAFNPRRTGKRIAILKVPHGWRGVLRETALSGSGPILCRRDENVING